MKKNVTTMKATFVLLSAVLSACNNGSEAGGKTLSLAGGTGGVQPVSAGSCDANDVCGDLQSGCIQCAVAGVCAGQYETCMQSSDCVDFSNCAASCAADVGCQASCAAKYQAGAATYNSLANCIFCGVCTDSCDALDACSTGGKTPSSCDQTGTCGDVKSGCIACALNDMCAVEVDACNASSECAAYSLCITECESDSCSEWCRAYYPSGYQIFAELDECVFCKACPITCQGGATSSCM